MTDTCITCDNYNPKKGCGNTSSTVEFENAPPCYKELGEDCENYERTIEKIELKGKRRKRRKRTSKQA